MFATAFRLLAALAAICSLAVPLSSASAGVAIVQAVEQSFGACAADNAAQAFECAKEQCVKGGAAKADCIEMTYCTSGYAVDVFVQSNEMHWHEYSCGWTDKATALEAAKLVCNPERMKQLIECAAVQIIDETGKIEEISPQ